MTDEREPTSVIKLPNNPDLIAKLRRKHDEYTERLKENMKQNPYLAPEELGSWYAKRILGTLLEKGQLDFESLTQEIADEHGGYIARPDFFVRYCDVIADYAITGGLLAQGGTGLK